MIRALLAGALALAAVPAQAQEAPLNGVWQGSVGNLPIHACFDERTVEGGIYYYDRIKQLIRLEGQGDRFDERVGWAEEGSATWQLAPVSATRAEGSWRDGGRSLPIRLQRVDWEVPDPVVVRGPCESLAFNGPRLTGGQVVETAGLIQGAPYTVLTWQPPAHFAARTQDEQPTVAIASFALPERFAGDRAINGVLAAYLPQDGEIDEYADCLIALSSFRGIDGYYAQFAMPEVIGDRFVGMVESNDNFCGGAHPATWQHRRVFDRQSGVEVDPESWLNDAALARRIVGEQDYASVYAAPTDAFRAFLVDHWPQGEDVDPECAGVALDAYGWDMGLAQGGMVFLPELPRVIMVCATDVMVSWDELAPWLSLEGQAAAMAFAPRP